MPLLARSTWKIDEITYEASKWWILVIASMTCSRGSAWTMYKFRICSFFASHCSGDHAGGLVARLCDGNCRGEDAVVDT